MSDVTPIRSRWVRRPTRKLFNGDKTRRLNAIAAEFDGVVAKAIEGRARRRLDRNLTEPVLAILITVSSSITTAKLMGRLKAAGLNPTIETKHNWRLDVDVAREVELSKRVNTARDRLQQLNAAINELVAAFPQLES